ncbi:MAG: efflux RND transporter periplasmic adaptor subunit [Bacteroidia bacterium]
MKKISNIALLGIFCFAAACGSKNGEIKKGETTAVDSTKGDKIKMVGITALAPQIFNNYIDIQGKVDADENVSINAEMGGTVSKINVQLGDEVSAGQVLAELDAKVIQQGIAELQNSLDLATTMYNKQKNLWDQQIGTEVQYLSAKNQKESLEKRLSSLQQQLEMTKIKSPIKGIVDAIDIKLGQATMPGISAIRVVNLCTLKVKGEVAESYLAKVKKGNDVEIILPDMQDTLKTKISYAAKVISPLNRTFTVTVNLDCIKDYHPNMIAILKIVDYSNPKAFIAPVSTIQKTEDGDFVFIAQNNKAQKTRVKTGRIYNGTAEILDGLKEGDKLITKGFQELNEGEEIKY